MAPAHTAVRLHLLATLFAGFGAEGFYAVGHALLPLTALAGPAAGLPALEAAKQDGAQQQQSQSLG